MTTVVSLFEFMPYGAPELQSVARRYMVRALLLSSMLCTLLFAAAGLLYSVRGTIPVAPTSIAIQLQSLPAPPALEKYDLLLPVMPATRVQPSLGVPVPTPDERVSIEPTIPSQEQLRTISPGTEAGDRPLVVEAPAPQETLPPWKAYVYVEEMPVPVRMVNPEYPRIAQEAGVSGRVIAHVLVSRAGRVLDVKIDPDHSIPMLNDAAVQAVRQWAFKPALVNDRPIEVWVAVPFNFSLQ
jgi:protein TonB